VHLAAVNAGTELGRRHWMQAPIAGLLFVQVKVGTTTGPVKLVAGAEATIAIKPG